MRRVRPATAHPSSSLPAHSSSRCTSRQLPSGARRRASARINRQRIQDGHGDPFGMSLQGRDNWRHGLECQVGWLDVLWRPARSPMFIQCAQRLRGNPHELRPRFPLPLTLVVVGHSAQNTAKDSPLGRRPQSMQKEKRLGRANRTNESQAARPPPGSHAAETWPASASRGVLPPSLLHLVHHLDQLIQTTRAASRLALISSALLTTPSTLARQASAPPGPPFAFF